MGTGGAIFLILITIIFPPLGAYIVAGCGADVFINICLTILGYIPGHIHAFYLEYVYYERKGAARSGVLIADRAPGIYSAKVQNGGVRGYGTLAQQPGPNTY